MGVRIASYLGVKQEKLTDWTIQKLTNQISRNGNLDPVGIKMITLKWEQNDGKWRVYFVYGQELSFLKCI